MNIFSPSMIRQLDLLEKVRSEGKKKSRIEFANKKKYLRETEMTFNSFCSRIDWSLRKIMYTKILSTTDHKFNIVAILTFLLCFEFLSPVWHNLKLICDRAFIVSSKELKKKSKSSQFVDSYRRCVDSLFKLYFLPCAFFFDSVKKAHLRNWVEHAI